MKKLAFIVGIMLLSACQTTPQTQELLNQNKSLQEQLVEANTKIDQLEADNRLQQTNMDELNRVLSVLDTEKSSRVRESSSLRGQVRKFVQDQIDGLKEFLVKGDLLDYIGGELVERSLIEDKSMFLVDLAHPVPRSGILTGVAAHFSMPAPFTVKILRPIGNDLVVVWESKTIVVKESGISRFDFPVTVGLEKGDYLAYFFPEATGVSFDEGTSDTRFLTRDLTLGSTIKKSSLSGESKKRAYSIGVYGLLN